MKRKIKTISWIALTLAISLLSIKCKKTENKVPVFTIDVSIKSISQDGESFNVVITSNSTWTATSSEDWATLNQTSGTNNATITIKCSQNPNITQRIANITFSAKDVDNKMLVITQLAQMPTIPTVTTGEISKTTETQINITGNLSNFGLSYTQISQHGFCWSSTNNTPTIIQSSKLELGSMLALGEFSTKIENLTKNTKYYIRAFATNSTGTAYGDVKEFTTSDFPSTIGQLYGGGIIAYIYQSGDPGYVTGETHGLIVSTSDQSSSVFFSNKEDIFSTSTDFGTGSSNTTLIINACGTPGGSKSNYAAYICRNYKGGGFDDWFLPSINELNVLFETGALPSSAIDYWSSSESGLLYAFYQWGKGGIDYVSKYNSKHVRAVRCF